MKNNLNGFLNEMAKEKLELNRLARIGEATEKLFSENKVDILVNPEWCHGELEEYKCCITSIEELMGKYS